MEIRSVYVKKRSEFGKQCVFDLTGPTTDIEIMPDPDDTHDYILRSHCNAGIQHSKQLALHEVQTMGKTAKNSGMYHFEGGWPKEINPRDEETTARFRRRVEKDDNWAPKLRKLLEMMEKSVLQNGAQDIYQHYFSDMIPTELVQPVGLRAVNVYEDPEIPKRPVTNISWSTDHGSRIVVTYCFLEYGRRQDYSKKAYIWQVENPNEPYMALDPFCPCVLCEFNPRDPSVLASGLMTGQVCNWDIRTGTKPVQSSDPLFSHRDYVNSVRWLPSKSNSEFFSASSDGQAMWWDTRRLQKPVETLMFDFENPNEPNIDRAVGVSCFDYGPLVGTKFMFGMDNGIVVTGSRKVKTNAEKLAVRLEAHTGPVKSVDRNVFNPSVFLTVGHWTARVWAEDTREGCLVSTWYFLENPTGGCWNKTRCSVFYVITATGQLLAWDFLQGLRQPIFTLQLCTESLTALAPFEEGTLLAVGSALGKVFLVESTDFLQSFDKKDRTALSEYLDRHSKMTKAVDVRLREIKLSQKITEAQAEARRATEKSRSMKRTGPKGRDRGRDRDRPTIRERDGPTIRDRHTMRESRHSKRKSASKDKKKREDSPELVEAEQKYYELVQQGLEEYLTDSDPDLRRQVQHLQVRKPDRKQRRDTTDLRSSANLVRKEASAKPKEETSRVKTRRIRVKQKQTMISPSGFSIRSLRESSAIKSSSKLLLDELKRKRRRGRRPRFLLPVPCKGEVCKPRICCWRRDKGTREERTRIDRRRERVTSTKQTSSILRGETEPILSDTVEPPWELTLEAHRAREEIREMVARSTIRTRTVVQRPSETRPELTPEEQKQDGRERSVRVKSRSTFEEDTMSEREPRTKEDREEDKHGKRTVPVDPCSPLKAKSVTEEFSAILSIPMSEIAKKRKKRSDKKKLAQSTLYPRISEYRPSK